MRFLEPTHQSQTMDSLKTHLQAPATPALTHKDAGVPKKITLQPALSHQDSLMLNLTGQDQTSTNWKISLKPNSEVFNETAFTWLDAQLIDSLKVKPDSVVMVTDSTTLLPTTQLDTTLVTAPEIHTEQAEPEPIKPLVVKPPLQEDWFLAVLIGSLLIAGFVRLNWGNYLKNLMQSIVFSNSMSKLEGSNASNLYPSLVLGTLFYFNTSIFIFQILVLSGRNFLGFGAFLIIPVVLLFLLVLFSSKMLVYRMVGVIFETKVQVREYLFGSATMSKAYGILLIPIILLMPFVDETIQPLLVKAGLALFILLYLMQIGRGVRIILTNTFSVYYIILYLCALEILPLTILFKVMFR